MDWRWRRTKRNKARAPAKQNLIFLQQATVRVFLADLAGVILANERQVELVGERVSSLNGDGKKERKEKKIFEC